MKIESLPTQFYEAASYAFPTQDQKDQKIKIKHL